MAYIDCSSIVLGGLNMDCNSSIGGIKKVWLTVYADIDEEALRADSNLVDITETDAGGRTVVVGKGINSIPFKSSAINPQWWEYEFRKNTGSLTSTLNVDETNGNNYITSELSLVFSRMDTKKRVEMQALATGAVAAVVLDSNNKYWFLGYDDYVSASAGTGETGTAKEDRNAYTVTLSTDSTVWPYELTSAAVAEVTA